MWLKKLGGIMKGIQLGSSCLSTRAGILYESGSLRSVKNCSWPFTRAFVVGSVAYHKSHEFCFGLI